MRQTAIVQTLHELMQNMTCIKLNYLFHGIGCSRMFMAGYYYNYNQSSTWEKIIIIT